jgi:hypothetical protein
VSLRDVPGDNVVGVRKIDVFDLYDARPIDEVVPFECEIGVEGVKGLVRVWSSWDEGTLAAVMCKQVYDRLKDQIGLLRSSVKQFRLADGSLVNGEGRWVGQFSIGKVRAWGVFEVFNSGGNWEFLLGKLLKRAFKVMYQYDVDTVEVSDGFGALELRNQREGKESIVEDVPVCVVEEGQACEDVGEPVDVYSMGEGVFTRKEDPFSEKRVAEVLRLVTIGDDLTTEERQAVKTLVVEYADCFVLSVSKVLPVDGVVHKLDIPEGAMFSKKVRQRPLTPTQKKYLHAKIDEMLEAGVIEACSPDEVKCVSPTTLAQKAHEGEGLSLVELQHQVNDQCVAAGLEPYFLMPEREVTRVSMEGKEEKLQK